MASNGTMEIYQPDAQVGELKLWRPPAEVLAEAHQVCLELKKYMDGKKNPVVFNGKRYMENDDWQFVSNFFGYAPKVESTEFVDYGGVRGFKAVAILLNERTSLTVGRGEALCLDEEQNWGAKAKYEWQGREKVQVDTVNTPMFQLLSMAQTRACNKAMSNKLKWVASLAGYEPTPAEDMHDATLAPEAPQPAALPAEIKRKEPAPAHSQQAPPPPAKPVQQARPVQSPRPAQVRVISEAQARRFYAIWKSAGRSAEQVKEYLKSACGVSTDREMPVDRYTAACHWAETGEDNF
jgi:hypothetical protein